MRNIKIVSWDEIETRYIDLINHGWKLESMLPLLKHIQTSGLVNRLFAFTSLDTLIITIYNPAEWHAETLHIKFNTNSNMWHFEYHSKPFDLMEAERSCAEKDLINLFSKYITLLKW